jgi:DNA-directed RNA polymerase specialized sigma24 family protein
MPDDRPVAPDIIAEDERRDRLMTALADLIRADPEGARVLIGHDLDSIPIVEIGEAIGLSASTVYKRRARALEQLQADLRERDRDG